MNLIGGELGSTTGSIRTGFRDWLCFSITSDHRNMIGFETSISFQPQVRQGFWAWARGLFFFVLPKCSMVLETKLVPTTPISRICWRYIIISNQFLWFINELITGRSPSTVIPYIYTYIHVEVKSSSIPRIVQMYSRYTRHGAYGLVFVFAQSFGLLFGALWRRFPGARRRRRFPFSKRQAAHWRI